MNTKEFQKSVGSNCSGPNRTDKLSAIIDGLERSIAKAEKTAKSIGLTGDELLGLRNRLTEEARDRWTRTRYATVDLSFTDGTQTFAVGRNPNEPSKLIGRPLKGLDDTREGEVEVELPNFVCNWSELDSLLSHYRRDDRFHDPDHRVNNLGTIPAVRINNEHFHKVDVRASVKVPSGVSEVLFGKIRKCIAYLRLFDVLLIERGLRDPDSRFHSEVGILWAPTESSWVFRGEPERPKGDPAILVRIDGGTPCLVGYFDAPDEKPIDNLIREFSRGKVGGKLPKR